MVSEQVLHLLVPYAFFDGVKFKEYVVEYDIWIQYEINDLLLALSFVRIIFAIRNVLYLTMFCNQRAQRICNTYGCYARPMFAIKCLMKLNP